MSDLRIERAKGLLGQLAEYLHESEHLEIADSIESIKEMEFALDQINKINDKLEAENKELRESQEWVSVDKPPTSLEFVSVYCGGSENVGIAWYDGENWVIPNPQSIGEDCLTHWKPLPKPPQGD